MRDCLVVDDDEVTRELTVLFAGQAGFQANAVESGEEALRVVTEAPAPYAILLDMQMPGLTGAPLAEALRAVCGPYTRLVAMSASQVKTQALAGFDCFLLKPFSIEQLQTALEGQPVLSEATYASLAGGMPRTQLLELYAMCLDDADRRIGLMRALVAAGDRDAYERAAHAIKGGCGMVGALELAALAEEMEQNGPAGDGSTAPLDNFLLASTRLRRILGAQSE